MREHCERALLLGEGICYYIVQSSYVTNDGGELRCIIELSCLPRRMVVRTGVQCKCKEFMIGDDVELSSLKIVSEMMNSRINC